MAGIAAIKVGYCIVCHTSQFLIFSAGKLSELPIIKIFRGPSPRAK
jgi:hypothetical protein